MTELSAMPELPSVCIIPAAGRSSRMGDWKPLLPWGKSTIIETVIATIQQSGNLPLVVCGWRGTELRDRLSRHKDLVLVDNPLWEQGMLGSVRLGIQEAAKLVYSQQRSFCNKGCLVVPADMPLLPAEIIRQLLTSARTAVPLPQSIFPVYRNQPGHPVWISYELLHEMDKLSPSERLRPFLTDKAHSTLQWADDCILQDIDTPETYCRLRQQA